MLLPRLKGDERAHLAASLERLPQLDEALEALPALRGALGPLAARPELSGLLGLLRKLAPRLMGPAAMALLEEVRALPPGPGGGLARWRLLTALTKQLTYDDLQAALRDCALQPKPTRARLLEEAFQIRLGGATPLPAERAPEPEQLAGALAATEHAPPEREEALLRWAIEQRPLGLPLWRPEAAKAPRAKPTTEQRVAALKGAEALEAAIWLLERATQPEAHRAVMVAYLDGLMLPLDALPCLAQRLTPADLEHPRAYTLLEHLHPDQRRWALTPLLSRWADGDEAAKAALSSMPRDAVVAEVRARVAEGSPGAVRLLSEAEIERHPELVKAAKALGALSPPSREPPTPQRAFARDPEARRAQLAAEALSEDLEVARAALSALEARGWGDAALYLDILQGGAPKLRLAALRGLKKVAPGEAYLEAVEGCLEDERRPDVEAQLIRALAYSGYEPAARALVARLNHNHKKIREDARLGVRRLGAAALRELHRAARRARPDQRSIYAALIEELEER